LEDDLTYRDIRTIHQTERDEKNNLTEIRRDFYVKAKEYIEKLKKNLEIERDEYKKKLISDELKSATQIIRDIYKMREKKIVLAALSKVRGGKPDTRFLLENEKKLFDDVVECLKRYREIILEGKEEAKEEVGEEKKERRFIALIKGDIPRFVGPDMRTYSLRRGDIVCLPESIFKILESKGVAESIL